MAEYGDVFTTKRLDRTLQLTIQDFRPGATGPTSVKIGTTPTAEVLRFDATGETVTLVVPAANEKDAAPAAGSVTVGLFIQLIDIESDGDTLDLTVDYVIPKFNTSGAGITKTSTQITPSLTVTTARGLGPGTPYLFAFQLDVADANNPIDDVNVAGLVLEFHLTNTTGVARFYLLGGCVTVEMAY